MGSFFCWFTEAPKPALAQVQVFCVALHQSHPGLGLAPEPQHPGDQFGVSAGTSGSTT